MPIFDYCCLECGHKFEKLVMPMQTGIGEAEQCPECRSNIIEKIISAPAQIRTDGKDGLRTTPDPIPPLQKLKEGGAREGCIGGYGDLPEFKPTKRTKTKKGNWIWTEKDKKHIDLGRKKK